MLGSVKISLRDRDRKTEATAMHHRDEIGVDEISVRILHPII